MSALIARSPWSISQGLRMKLCLGLHRVHQLSDQELEHVAVVPGCLLPPGAHAGLWCPVATDDVERDLAQERQVAHAAVVLAKCHIQHPMQGIFYGPMQADGLAQDSRTVRTARQEVADLALHFSPSFRLADTRKWRKSWENGLNRAKNIAM